jgi:hypothetical protein
MKKSNVIQVRWIVDCVSRNYLSRILHIKHFSRCPEQIRATVTRKGLNDAVYNFCCDFATVHATCLQRRT